MGGVMEGAGGAVSLTFESRWRSRWDGGGERGRGRVVGRQKV